MKRIIALLLAIFCMTALVACPAPAPGGESTTTTASKSTTTTSGSGSGSGSGGGAPSAPLSLTAESAYALVDGTITLTAGGTEGKSVWFTYPDGSVKTPVESGVTFTATAAEEGVHTFTVTDGTRTASCTVTVFSKEESTLPATDENIRILGRTEKNAEGAIIFNNTASGFEITFYGTSLTVWMCNAGTKSDTAKFALYIDGEGDAAVDQIDLRTAGLVSGNTREIPLCTFETAGLHTVRLQKITQESLATALFSGVSVVGGLLPTVPDEDMRLLIYGDSITCGHSNMRPDGAPDSQNSTNENGMLTYAMRAAAMLNADAHVIAKSGIGLYTDPYAGTIHMKDVYDRVSPASTTAWDMQSWIPDAVVINLGTNDIWATKGSPGDPPYAKEDFIAAYMTMVRELVAIWGDQTTFFLCSSMMDTNLGAHVQEVVTRLINEDGIAVYFVDLPYRLNNGGHPTNASHMAAADVLYLAISEVMGIY